MKKIKLCIVTEFVQENFFQWKMALDYCPELEVSSAVMNKDILKAYPLNDSLWDSIREADVVFVYCVRHDLNWEWYTLPFLVKKIMNSNAKMICQFDLEFLWLFYPNHHFWKKEVIWAKDKTPEQFFRETEVMEVADAYIVLANRLLEKYTSKPIYYLPLPQLVRYDSFLKTIPSKKNLRNKSKRIVILRHSVKSASIKRTLNNVIVPLKVPVTIFTTDNTDSEGKFKILKILPQPRKSVIYGNIPRDVYIEFLERGYAAIDDNKGYYAWSRFAMECALTHVPCVGSTRAVKEFFPELYTKPKDYEKQKELLKKLCSDEDFWLKMVSSGKKLVLKKMNTDYLTKKFVEIITSIVTKTPKTNLIEKLREPTPVESNTSELLEWKKYRSFVEKWELFRRSIPSKPPKGGSVMDTIHKRILTQREWDIYYGKWRKFIEGYKPKDFVEEMCKTDIGKADEVNIDAFKRKKPLTSLNTINPILVIWSPRDIAEVKKAFDEIDYVDKVWFKYFNKSSVLRQTKYFMNTHKEYTHLIIVSDDVVCSLDSVKTLLENFLVYDFPILSGCFNLCNTWESRKGYCTKCEQYLPHDYINITFDPIDLSKKITMNSYNWITEEWRKTHPIIKRVWFEGFGLAMIRREIYEKIGFRGIGFQHTTDIPWAVDLAEAGIPQFCDFKVKLRHRAFPEDRDFLVGKKAPKIIFQPAKRRLMVTSTFKLILAPRWKEILNVLLLIDQFGWAFDFGARGIQKYSKHNCVIKRFWDDVTPKDVLEADVVFAFNSCSAQHLWKKEEFIKAIKKTNPKIFVGARGSPIESGHFANIERNFKSVGLKINGVPCNSKEVYDWLKEVGKEINAQWKAYLVYSAVDHQIFTPREGYIRKWSDFNVGWCGYARRKVKRHRLLKLIKFSTSEKKDWGRQFFVKDRSQKPMADWYHTLDAYICVSEVEGLPQPIVEAMASGLPVVSTAVGAIPDLVDEEWLVPVYPKEEVVRQINEKLQLLKDDLWLRKKVGKRNRQKVLNTWSWKHIVKNYDKMFEGK